MIRRGVTAAEERALRSTLAGAHRVRVSASILTLGHSAAGNLTPYVTDGQVDVDATAAVTRSATLTMVDATRSLPFDTDGPADTALYLDRMIHVVYHVLVDDEWIGIDVFTGPVTDLSRDGDLVSVTAQGKETFHLGAAFHPITLRKGMKKTDAIRRLLTEANEAYVETRLDIPDLPARLPKAISLGRASQPWEIATRIARGMGLHLFYDGAGTCRLRQRPDTVGFSFTGEHHVVSQPQISHSADIANAVYVLGGVPKGSKSHVHALAVAPRNHPLSAHRIGRYLLPGGDVTQDDTIKTVAEAQARADHDLHDGLLQSVDVSFDSVPVPFLDPQDLCHVGTDGLSVTFRLQKFSLPLVLADGAQPMSVGYHRNVARGSVHRGRKHPPRKRRRR